MKKKKLPLPNNQVAGTSCISMVGSGAIALDCHHLMKVEWVQWIPLQKVHWEQSGEPASTVALGGGHCSHGGL